MFLLWAHEYISADLVIIYFIAKLEVNFFMGSNSKAPIHIVSLFEHIFIV